MPRLWRKKKEQVAFSGDFSRAQIKKKKKKVKAILVPIGNHEFYFTDKYSNWQTLLETRPLREDINPDKLAKLWSELSNSKRAALLDKMKLDTNLSKSTFNDLPDNVKKTFTGADKGDLLKTLGLISGVALVGLYLNILKAPIDKPVSQIRDEPLPSPRDPLLRKDLQPKGDREPGIDKSKDREPSFDQVSSFVGKVTYSRDFQTMEINLSGKVYGFCNVPERVFDAFSGAGSKGKFFNQTIKTQFNC